jgi:hypothetical protein
MRDVASDLGGPPPYEVLLLEGDPAAGAEHQHVVAVQTRDPDGGETRWATVDVISALRAGEQFVVSERSANAPASLEPGLCPACAAVTISVSPGGTEIAPR